MLSSDFDLGIVSLSRYRSPRVPRPPWRILPCFEFGLSNGSQIRTIIGCHRHPRGESHSGGEKIGANVYQVRFFDLE